jgi:hypothetical protein
MFSLLEQEENREAKAAVATPHEIFFSLLFFVPHFERIFMLNSFHCSLAICCVYRKIIGSLVFCEA